MRLRARQLAILAGVGAALLVWASWRMARSESACPYRPPLPHGRQVPAELWSMGSVDAY